MQAVTKFSAELGRTLHQWRVWKRTSCAQSVKRLKTPPKKDRLHRFKTANSVHAGPHRAVSQCNKGPFHNPTKGHTRLFPNAEKSFISEKVVNVSLKSVRMLPATKKHGRQKNSGRNKTLPVEVFSRLSLPAYCMSPSCRKTREPPIYPTDASLPASLPEGPDAAIPWCSRGHPPHRRRERHARSRAGARVTQQQQQIAAHLGRD